MGRGHFHSCSARISRLCERLVACTALDCDPEIICGSCARDLKQMSLDAAFWNEVEAGIQRAWEKEHYSA